MGNAPRFNGGLAGFGKELYDQKCSCSRLVLENAICHAKEPEGTRPCDGELTRADLVLISVTPVDPALGGTQSSVC